MAAVARVGSTKVRKRLDVLEDSREKIVLREKPHHVLGAVFCVCGLAMLGLIVSQRPRPGQGVIVTVIIFAGLALLSFGIFCLVESTISVGMESRELSVRRRIGFLKTNKQYPVQSISRVFVRASGKGNGLGLNLVSGRTKNLTFFTEYADPAEQAGKLNHFIRRAAKRSVDPK
jgi:hypothetical protein